MKKWILTASRDAIDIHFETIIESETEPGYWECYGIATAHDCEYFIIEEAPEQ